VSSPTTKLGKDQKEQNVYAEFVMDITTRVEVRKETLWYDKMTSTNPTT